MLESKGLKLDEAMIAGLSALMGFVFDCNRKYGSEIIQGKFGNYLEVIKSFEDINQIKISRTNFPDFNRALNYLNKQAREEKLTMLVINDYGMKGELHNGHMNAPRIVVCIKDGRNQSGVHVYDVDRNIEDINKLLKSWEKCDFEYYEFDDTGLGLYDPRDKIITALSKTIENMECKNHEAEIKGLNALDRFYKSVVEMGSMDTSESISLLKSFYIDINRPGGVMVSRLFFSQFLEQISVNLQDTNMMQISQEYYKVSKDWHSLSNILFRLSVFPKDESLHENLIRKLYMLVEKENGLILKLKEACSPVKFRNVVGE